jgi:hypothetical protein
MYVVLTVGPSVGSYRCYITNENNGEGKIQEVQYVVRGPNGGIVYRGESRTALTKSV